MNYTELIERLPKHPNEIMQNSFGRETTSSSYYLYESHRMDNCFYEGHVWIFNSIAEFIDFLPAIIFYDIAINFENDDFEGENYSEKYNEYVALLNKNWDENECKKFVAEFEKTSELEPIEFGKVSDLLNVTQEVYDKCDAFLNLDELENLKIPQGTYQILNKFHDESSSRPSLNEEAFLEMLQNWVN